MSVENIKDAEQARLMDEQCILVDLNDKVIGHAAKKLCHRADLIAKGEMCHRAFSVFLFNSKGELMLQQRAACKVTFAERWTNTCCSHPLYGTAEIEEYEALGVKRAAIRKLEHELGISGEITEADLHFLTKIHYSALSDGEWGEHEVDWILFCQKDVSVHLNDNEVMAIKYVNASTLRTMFHQSHQGLLYMTPWFEMICNTFLYGWWEQLDTIISNKGIGEEARTQVHYLKLKQSEPSTPVEQEVETTNMNIVQCSA